jgi:hypothetical protein
VTEEGVIDAVRVMRPWDITCRFGAIRHSWPARTLLRRSSVLRTSVHVRRVPQLHQSGIRASHVPSSGSAGGAAFTGYVRSIGSSKAEEYYGFVSGPLFLSMRELESYESGAPSVACSCSASHWDIKSPTSHISA